MAFIWQLEDEAMGLKEGHNVQNLNLSHRNKYFFYVRPPSHQGLDEFCATATEII